MMEKYGAVAAYLPATQEQLEKLAEYYGGHPDDYADFNREAAEEKIMEKEGLID
jgi:hypothetical protein